MLLINTLSITHSNLHIAINNVRFESGLHIVIGPNGSGKSTFLNALIGYGEHIMHRELLYNDHQLADTSEVISFMPQESERFTMTTADYIYMTSRNRKENLLEKFYLTYHAGSSIHQLSTGEFKRAQLAQLINEDKPILIVDEVEAALDVKYKYEMLNHLKHLSHKKIVIASVHDLSLAMTYADYIHVLKAGQFLATARQPSEIDATLLSYAYDTTLEITTVNQEMIVHRGHQ